MHCRRKLEHLYHHHMKKLARSSYKYMSKTSYYAALACFSFTYLRERRGHKYREGPSRVSWPLRGSPVFVCDTVHSVGLVVKMRPTLGL